MAPTKCCQGGSVGSTTPMGVPWVSRTQHTKRANFGSAQPATGGGAAKRPNSVASALFTLGDKKKLLFSRRPFKGQGQKRANTQANDRGAAWTGGQPVNNMGIGGFKRVKC